MWLVPHQDERETFKADERAVQESIKVGSKAKTDKQTNNLSLYMLQENLQ